MAKREQEGNRRRVSYSEGSPSLSPCLIRDIFGSWHIYGCFDAKASVLRNARQWRWEMEQKREHVSHPFYSILFVVLTSLSRYYYFRLLGDESPFVAIIASFMTDDAVHNNTLSPIRAASQNHVLCRCHWLSFRAIKIHVCTILQFRRYNSIVITGKSMGFTLKGKLILVTN